ncbi:ATP-binding protein, partial [Amycolatopsis sp.]|uniref:ATP-binding protein n=1 Tax=Amycolatopsis sp. TaxID=37632 RepID=UPI002E060776|nr:sensor histidine kinase [Amycolatopsis sp.]
QEALTNARKHAPGARVNVHIGHCDGELSATVENGRPTRPTLSLPSARHGLVGLRERAELLEGAFERLGQPSN